jgi:SNF family Na+-dependent transporter
MFSSFKDKRTAIGHYAWHFCVGVGVCGLLSVLIVYIYMFHFAGLYRIPFEDVVVSGPSLAFVVFSQAFSLLPWPNLWSLLFYFTLILLGIDSEFGFMEAVAASVEDSIRDFHLWPDKELIRKTMGAALCCCALLFSFGNGYHIVLLIDSFTCNLPIPFICLLQSYLIGQRLDYQKVEDHQLRLTGQPTSPLILSGIRSARVSYILTAILVVGVVDQLRYSASLSLVLNVLGWAVTLSPFLLTLYFLVQPEGGPVSVDRLDVRDMLEQD